MEKVIWVLGSKHPNAHKSISWLSAFPNFANCDVLIVNLQSVGREQFSERELELFGEARRYIFDLLMAAGEKEVFIISSSDQNLLEWLPIYPNIREIARVEIATHETEPPISEYMRMVEDCPYYIHDFNVDYAHDMTNPESGYHENYPFTSKARLYLDDFGSNVTAHSSVRNKAKQLVGGSFRYEVRYGRRGEERFVSGVFHFLPPPTRCTPQQSIDIMVNALTGGELIESPPPWENKLDMPRLLEIRSQIVQKEEEKEKLIEDIKKLRDEEGKLVRFRRLLWTKGMPLENIVKEAFLFLGFSEIGKIRESNLEDWVIDLKFTSEYTHGAFEIKGADKRTSLADLTQCNKWVDDYIVENRGYAKGIFVPNQNRLGDIRKNKEKREHFEDNELKYAGSREICILPSHEIFYAVVEKMKSNPQITRKFIEEKIAASHGICKLSERK